MLDEPIFSLRPWRPEFGDPAAPTVILGLAVTRRLLARTESPAALVQLADRRFALTGPVLVIGAARPLADYLRRRGAPRRPDGDAWIPRVLEVLAAQRPPHPAADPAR
jgi:cell volume regulation protein A